jgi:hypothetical protein
MSVRYTFQAPDNKKFEVLSESGPGPVRDKVFRRMLDSELKTAKGPERTAAQISPRNYDFTLIGKDTVDGRSAFVLNAEPKTKNEFLFRGKVWIDEQDFAVARIEGAPAKNPSIWVRKTQFVHRYQKHGPFWLAISNHSDTDVVIFSHTEVKIEYGDYNVEPKP